MNLFESFRNYLIKNEMKFVEFSDSGCSIDIRMNGSNGIIYSTIYYIQEKGVLMCLSHFPYIVPKERQDILLTRIMKINYRLLFSNFLLNKANGYLQLKTVLYSNSFENEEEVFNRFYFGNVMTIDHHFGDIHNIIFEKNTSPNEINLN